MPKMTCGMISQARGIHCSPLFVLSPDQRLYIVNNICIQICVAYRRGYVLRNASLGDFVVVRTLYSVLTQT